MHWGVVCGLIGVYVVYVVLGGVGFHYLENEEEENLKNVTREMQRQFLGNSTCLTRVEMQKFITGIINAYERGVLINNNKTSPPNWDIVSSIFFSITIVTTIGYGHISPSTILGRVFCVIFALFGIPLTAVMLAGIGGKLTEAIDRFTRTKCCTSSSRENHCKVSSTLVFIVTGVIVLMILPCFFFMAMEGWDFGTAFYYSCITLTTIGFGDYVAGVADHPYRGYYRIGVAIWIVLGLAWLSTIIGLIQNTMQQRANTAEDKIDKRRRNNKKVDQTRKEMDNGVHGSCVLVNYRAEQVEVENTHVNSL